jgi:hypothetical protein
VIPTSGSISPQPPTVDRYREQSAKGIGIDVRGREDRFLQIHAGTRQIVVPRRDIDLCGNQRQVDAISDCPGWADSLAVVASSRGRNRT